MQYYKFTFGSWSLAAADGLENSIRNEEICFACYAHKYNLKLLSVVKNNKANRIPRIAKCFPLQVTFGGKYSDIVNFINHECLELEDLSNEDAVEKAWKDVNISKEDIYTLTPAEYAKLKQGKINLAAMIDTKMVNNLYKLLKQAGVADADCILHEIGYKLFNISLANFIAPCK